MVDILLMAQRPGLLDALERGGAITALQAKILADHWPDLPEDRWSDPYLGSLREHTRAYIDQLASVAPKKVS